MAVDRPGPEGRMRFIRENKTRNAGGKNRQVDYLNLMVVIGTKSTGTVLKQTELRPAEVM